MPLIQYPAELPPPSGYPFSARERRALPQGAGDEQPRARAGDQLMDATPVRWRYSPEEMAVWREWYESVLLEGQLWFAATLPGRGGWTERVARYAGEVSKTHLGAGIWELSARLEIRGRSAAPQLPDIVPCEGVLTHCDETSGTTAESELGPDLLCTGAGVMSPDAARFGSGGWRASGTGNAGLTTTELAVPLTDRYLTAEGWFRRRNASPDADGLVSLLAASAAGGANSIAIDMNNSGTGSVLALPSSNTSVPLMNFGDTGVWHWLVWSYDFVSGVFRLWKDGVLLYTLESDTAQYTEAEFNVASPITFTNGGGGPATCNFDVDEFRLSVCGTDPYGDAESLPVPDGPFSGL